MTQLFIVYLIIAAAISYTIYSLITTLKIKGTGSCGDSCACSAKDEFRKAIKKGQIKIVK